MLRVTSGGCHCARRPRPGLRSPRARPRADRVEGIGHARLAGRVAGRTRGAAAGFRRGVSGSRGVSSGRSRHASRRSCSVEGRRWCQLDAFADDPLWCGALRRRDHRLRGRHLRLSRTGRLPRPARPPDRAVADNADRHRRSLEHRLHRRPNPRSGQRRSRRAPRPRRAIGRRPRGCRRPDCSHRQRRR